MLRNISGHFTHLNFDFAGSCHLLCSCRPILLRNVFLHSGHTNSPFAAYRSFWTFSWIIFPCEMRNFNGSCRSLPGVRFSSLPCVRSVELWIDCDLRCWQAPRWLSRDSALPNNWPQISHRTFNPAARVSSPGLLTLSQRNLKSYAISRLSLHDWQMLPIEFSGWNDNKTHTLAHHKFYFNKWLSTFDLFMWHPDIVIDMITHVLAMHNEA